MHYPLLHPTTSFDAIILAGGNYPSHALPRAILAGACHIVCCDSAFDLLEPSLIDRVDAIVGDGDSLPEAAKQQYLRAKRGSTSEQKTIADSHVSIAQAAVKETEALEAETQLLSPVDGVVANVYGHNTEFVAPGIPVVAILASKTMKVDLTVREDQYKTLYQRKQIEGYVPALDKTGVFNIKNIGAEGEFATWKNTRQNGGYDIRSFKFALQPQAPIAELKVGMSVVFKVQQAR